MCQGIPIPELAEENHANDSIHILASCPTLKTNGNIAATCVNQTLAKRCTESCHRIFMLVTDDLCIQGSGCSAGWCCRLRLLNKNHAQCNKSSLAYKVDRILGHWFQYLHSILYIPCQCEEDRPLADTDLQSCACTCNTERQCGTTSNMGVVTLAEQLHQTGNLARILE